MRLRTKFNLAILGVFVVGLGATALLLQQIAEADARSEVLQNARIMMAAANAIRKYTISEIVPLIGDTKDGRFLAELVPSFAAQTNFQTVRQQFPDYTYKEPTLNPTNPVDRATDWEADLINGFRDKPGQTELIAERDTPNGRFLTLSRPITIHDEKCLACHSVPANAPAAMVEVYGSANGYGWHVNETVGAQVVSVPMSLPFIKAQHTFLAFLAILGAVFVLMTIILNVLLHFVVTRPVVKMSRIAEQVSLGNAEVEEFEATGRDEIASLSQSFNRMRRSLESAMKMLGAEDEGMNGPGDREAEAGLPRPLGRYVLDAVLGRGAMGTVYRAHDPVIDRTVAIKLVRTDLLDAAERQSFLDRFRLEVRAAGRCSHPNIVAVHDFSDDAEAPYIVMEFVAGRTLQQRLREPPRLAAAEAVEIIRQVLAALAYAHRQAIVHRDIKPANVIVLADGRVKLMDFGIARMSGSTMTEIGTMIGTLRYMAPEQAAGRPVDHRADLFSTAVMLFEMLTGDTPFSAPTAGAILLKLTRPEPADLGALAGALAGFAPVLARGLAKPPEERFADAESFAQALAPATAGNAALDAGEQATVIQISPTRTPTLPPRAAGSSAGWEAGFLEGVEKDLTVVLGPMSKFVVQRAAVESGTAEELCATVARSIANETERHRFLERARPRLGSAPTIPPAPAPALPPQPGPAEAVPDAAVAAAQRALAFFIGPIAKLVARDAARKSASADEFCEALLAQLPRPEQRTQFRQRFKAEVEPSFRR